MPSGGGGIYARASNGSSALISTTLFDTPHRYRIEWSGSTFTFYVDGATTPAATLTQTGATSMVALISDFNLNGSALSVDWMKVTPYVSSGTFVSRVLDGSIATSWLTMSWAATTPSGTSVAMSGGKLSLAP